MNGNYALDNVAKGATLEFSYIGMVTQNIAINGRGTINVQMKDENQQLEEVVVVGYGVQKKSSMTAAVSSVSAKEVQKQVTANVASALQGRTPGVEILQRGGIAGAGGKYSSTWCRFVWRYSTVVHHRWGYSRWARCAQPFRY